MAFGVIGVRGMFVLLRVEVDLNQEPVDVIIHCLNLGETIARSTVQTTQRVNVAMKILVKVRNTTYNKSK